MEGIILGLMIPLAGTTAGAACVYLMKERMPDKLHKLMLGFAAGVMVAASIWSLIIPAMDMASDMGGMRVVPAVVGFALGIAFLLLLDKVTPHQHPDSLTPEGPRNRLSRTSRLALAVTIHNIPEGMAVGVTLAAAIESSSYITMAAAMALSVGIAVQNFPEGAIVSMPLRAAGNSRHRAFTIGALSGLVEPVAGAVTMLLAAQLLPAMPYLLSFAAGAMMYVVVEEVIPETQHGKHSDLGTIGFAIGFMLMLVLDVVLG